MIKLPVYNLEGKSLGSVEALAEVFGREPNPAVLHTALTWFLASKRRGTQNTKTRAEVRGGGAKPWKQKGTGRARAGSSRSPLWKKGGVIFGPKPRSYGYSLPKKIRKLALKVALSEKAKENRVKVLEEFKIEAPKTRLAAKSLKDLEIAGKALIVFGKENEIISRAFRNLKGVTPIPAAHLNIFDILASDWVVMDKEAVKYFEEALV